MTQKAKGASHVVTAADVAAGSIDIYIGFIGVPNTAVVQVRTAAGVEKLWDGVVTKADGVLTVYNSGTSDWAATDVISVIVAA